MTWILIFTRIVCTLEGVVGAALNLYLFFLVALSKQASTSDRVYKIAISVFSVHGFTLCALIATMNYGHIFREGTFIITIVGPLEPYIMLPPSVNITAAMVLAVMIWTLVPATSTLQLITLSMKHHYSEGKRLFLSFLFPVICIGIISATVQELMPAQEFKRTLIRLQQEFYGVNGSVLGFGGTMRYPKQNNDRTLTFFAVFYAIVPYALTYAALGCLIIQIQRKLRVPGMAVSERTMQMQRSFLTMQLLQSVLPLVILSSPFSVFVFAVFTQTDLTLCALWFTTFIWLCPSVQAMVQLRYIRQAIRARSQEASTVFVTVSRVQSRAQSKAESRVQSKAESRAESKAESRAESRVQSVVQSRAQSRAQSKAESRSESGAQ